MYQLPTAWTPKVRMDRIIVHWTAGVYTASDFDKKAYHLLIEGDGDVVRGMASIAANSGKLKDGYAAHTRSCNTNSIGVSICCMAGAVESPYNPGKCPMKAVQFDRLVEVVAGLCRAYNIKPDRKTVLSHAEVQQTLGIAQKAKWDYTRLAFDDGTFSGAIKIGDELRRRAALALKGAPAVPSQPTQDQPTTVPLEDLAPMPLAAQAETTASSLNTRTGPNGTVNGKLPKGTKVIVEQTDGMWAEVSTPAGYKVWVAREYLDLIDGPPPTEPTTPSPLRLKLTAIRALLDEIEAEL